MKDTTVVVVGQQRDNLGNQKKIKKMKSDTAQLEDASNERQGPISPKDFLPEYTFFNQFPINLSAYQG